MAVKVKMLVSRCGANGAENRGDVVSVSADEAARMITAGQAAPVAKEKREKAIRAKGEIR